MTVIAGFMVGSVPILFGDLLITSNSLPGQVTQIPAVGDVTKFVHQNRSILRLRQKLVVLTPHCAIGWAGSERGAANAIPALLSRAASGSLTKASLFKCLESIGELRQHPIAVIGWIMEGSRFTQFSWNAEDFMSEGVGRVVAAGTGIEAARQLTREKPSQGATGPEAVFGAMAYGASLAGVLLRGELANGTSARNLREFFGGGYEIVYFSGDRFRKMDDVTMSFWDARVLPSGVEFAAPSFVVKHRYCGEQLLVRSCRIESLPSSGRHEFIDEQFHPVRPIFPAADPTMQARDVPYHSWLRCHFFRVLVNGSFEIHHHIEAGGGEPILSFEELGDRIRFGFTKAAMNEIGRHLMGYLKPA